MKKEEIFQSLQEMKKNNQKQAAALSRACAVTDYEHLVRTGEQGGKNVRVWTEAFQEALNSCEIIRIPAAEEPYYLDGSLVIPSNRRIEAASGAVIRQMEGVRVLMFRNESTADGTHMPIAGRKEEGTSTALKKDCNISICGGVWEESWTKRAGYGKNGMYDEERSFYGVSTCMLFNNVENLTLTDMTFVHTAGFSVQAGDVQNAVFENIRFVECFADGLHINGNAENILIRNVSGQVGDDLVALNMYDWQNSSVNFGPARCVWCEDLALSPDSGYKALRIQPGVYYYEDDSSVDCSLYDAVLKNVRGINTFKMYFQTPAYDVVTGKPERGKAGSGGDIYFEDIVIDLDKPVDDLPEYLESHPVKGSIAGFELGSKLENLYFENIDITLHREAFPMSYLLCVGPKSVRMGNTEVFNPGLSSFVKKLFLKNIRINGAEPEDVRPYIREIVFEDIYGDGKSSGRGEIGEIIYERSGE